MKKLNKSDLRRQILTQYIELKVANGEYIGFYISRPLGYWNYEIIVKYMLEYTEEDFLCLDEDDRKYLKNTLAKLNAFDKPKVA